MKLGLVSLLLLFFTCSFCAFEKDLLRESHSVEESLFHYSFHQYHEDRNEYETIVMPYEDEEFNLNWIYNNLPENYKEDETSPNNVPDSYYDFIPLEKGVIFNGKPASWEDSCFGSLQASVQYNSTYCEISIVAKDKKDALCSSLYTFTTRERGYLKVFEFGGTHTIKFDFEQYQHDDVVSNGIGAFIFPTGVEGTAVSVAKTVSLFLDPLPNMVQHNVDFFGEKMQWSMKKTITPLVNITANDIKSGTMLAIIRLDGLDPMIAWGTGGHTGHTAIALWFGDELYICESTDAEGGFLTYWPPPYGIIRTPFNQWVSQAMDANYMVALTQLDPKLQTYFNETAAIEWFNEVQGMPYGWHNFIFTFIDTEMNNLPRPINPRLFEFVMGFAERLIPVDAKGSIYNMLIMGLNKRIGELYNNNTIDCQNLHCVYTYIDPLNISLEKACAIPENDNWLYNGNYSMVCDVWVFSVYKHAGVLEGMGLNPDLIQATEQTPKDVYQMALWDANWERPAVCVEANPNLPYCQLMGEYELILNGYNSVPLYEYINEECPSLYPVYSRTPGC